MQCVRHIDPARFFTSFCSQFHGPVWFSNGTCGNGTLALFFEGDAGAEQIQLYDGTSGDLIAVLKQGAPACDGRVNYSICQDWDVGLGCNFPPADADAGAARD